MSIEDLSHGGHKKRLHGYNPSASSIVLLKIVHDYNPHDKELVVHMYVYCTGSDLSHCFYSNADPQCMNKPRDRQYCLMNIVLGQ